jgi:broad specificity phosphatase PhoE
MLSLKGLFPGNGTQDCVKQGPPMAFEAAVGEWTPATAGTGLSAHCFAASSCKVVHFIRHAQGQHNEAFALRGENEEEYKNPAWRDARLTTFGVEQARILGQQLSKTPVELVFTSSLTRAVHTARVAFEGRDVPMLALDDLRERIGVHPCDNRRARSVLASEFPGLDVSGIPTEEDELYSPMVREPLRDMEARALRALDVIRRAPATHVAVVAHNDILVVLDRIMSHLGSGTKGGYKSDGRKIVNCGVRSVVLAFH